MNGFNSNATAYDPGNAFKLGQAAQLAYQDDISQTLQQWGLTTFQLLSNPATDTQGFIAGDNEVILIAFRGTQPNKIKDWLTDLNADHVDALNGKVHEGFYNGLLSIWSQLTTALQALRDNNQTIWITGHSLGAALAALAAAKLLADTVVPCVNGLYTFGQPRTGNADFASWFDAGMKERTFRFVNNNDIVPHVPPSAFFFKHVDNFVYFDADGDLKADIGFWGSIKDRLEGAVEGLWKDHLVPDEIADHFIDRYLENLEKNKNTNPF